MKTTAKNIISVLYRTAKSLIQQQCCIEAWASLHELCKVQNEQMQPIISALFTICSIIFRWP